MNTHEHKYAYVSCTCDKNTIIWVELTTMMTYCAISTSQRKTLSFELYPRKNSMQPNDTIE